MSAIYTINGSNSITIGGTVETGPFPKYSINRSVTSLPDGTPIGNKYNIEVSGVVLTDSTADIATPGELQASLHAKIITKLQTNISLGHNVGMLEIVPYGGNINPLVFLDAKLISIDIPEQTDDSSGVLYSDYTFSFEATEDMSNRDDSIFDNNLSSAEESWQISLDSEVSYSPGPSSTPYNTYTITHSVSATGNKKFIAGGEFSTSAWKEAANWVQGRLVSSPATVILTDAIGNSQFTSFTPSLMDNTSGPGSPSLTGYSFYNHLRLPNVDINAGSYSVTETWKASNISAMLDLEVSVSQDESENTTVSLSGTITGLDSTAVNTTSINKLANAETVLSSIDSSSFSLCNAYYNVSGGTLQSVVRSKNIGRNKGTGVITFSYSYNDIPVLIDNALTTSLRFTDDNELQLNKIVAVIPIISRQGGPIIQDMNTTNKRTRSVQLDAVMKKAYRTTKPTQPVALTLSYAPASAYLETLVENWEPGTGSYSINAEWVY